MRTGTVIENPPAGQRLHLVESPADTSGHSFTAEWTIAPRRGRDGVPPHIHRAASERFTVISGRAHDTPSSTATMGALVAAFCNVSQSLAAAGVANAFT